MQDFVTQFDLRAGVQHDPELVAAVMVLAREYATWIDGDDLDGAGEVVGVLLEPAPRFLYPY